MKIAFKSFHNFIICFVFVIFIFQNPLQTIAYPISLFDEMLTVLATIWGLAKLFGHLKGTKSVDRWRFKIVTLSIIIIIIGLLGNILFRIQRIEYIIIDIVSYLKFFAPLFLGWTFTVDQLDRKLKKTLSKICKVCIVVQFFLVLHEEFLTPWFPYLSDYGRIRSLRLYYDSQTYLVAYTIFLIGIVICFDGIKKNEMYLSAAVVCILSSMRSKAFGFIAAMIIVGFVINKIKIRRPVLLGVLISPIIIYLVKDKVILYFFTKSHFSPRSLILQEGLKIAIKYFPLGAGFGTFCSPGANLGGSPLYDVFGEYFQYMDKSITDFYWGSLLGQFGIISLIIYIYIVVLIVGKIWKIQFTDRRMFFSGIGFMLYLVIASVGELSFASTYVVGYSFFIGIVINSSKLKTGAKNEKSIIDN